VRRHRLAAARDDGGGVAVDVPDQRIDLRHDHDELRHVELLTAVER